MLDCCVGCDEVLCVYKAVFGGTSSAEVAVGLSVQRR